MELIGIFFVACGLLILAGIAKTVWPDDTARALVLLASDRFTKAPSLNLARQTVRIGALIEAALGIGALLFPRPVTAALVAASYALFVSVVAYARRHGGFLATCGCFGKPDTPPTGLHLLLNVIFVAAAIAVTLRPPDVNELVSLLGRQPWNGAPLVLAALVGVWLSYLALSPSSALEAARGLVGHPSGRH
jgi:hypothetical protein